jgi:hypothetical protein
MTRAIFRWHRVGQTLLALLFGALLLPGQAISFDVLDVVSGVIESPNFKGKDPIQKLRLAAELLRTKKLKQEDMALVLLDWGDQYLREPAHPLTRLERWAELGNDERLSRLRIPREFLNRILVVEYLLDETPYLKSTPVKKLELVSQLDAKHLVDPSVWLAYARLYAGGLISGAKAFDTISPLDELKALKGLKERRLVGWQYRVSAESILAVESVFLDPEYKKGSPYDRLLVLRALERQGLITDLTKKELERLPAWRLLANDSSFLKADRSAKRKRLSALKQEGLISDSTYTDLATTFRPVPLDAPPDESSPTALPETKGPTFK